MLTEGLNYVVSINLICKVVFAEKYCYQKHWFGYGITVGV